MGEEKKSSENDQLTGHFRECYFSFSELFLKIISLEQTVKLEK